MDETADDGLAAAGIVRILNDRQDQSCRVTRVPAVGQNSIGRTCKPKSRQIVPTLSQCAILSCLLGECLRCFCFVT